MLEQPAQDIMTHTPNPNINTLSIDDIRQLYLDFFAAKEHLIYTSAPIKSDDPTLMFTSAGMVQFKPYFLGATPKFAGFEGVHYRVTTAQKCLRINDIENVGRTLRHHSFFEMMGNFSFGDYFKKEAASWAWEFLTSSKCLGLDPKRLYVTIYHDDDEAFDVWTKHVGIPAERISRWDEDENFWPANAVSAGPNGPCGPCSEIFYDRGSQFGTDDETGPNTGSGDRYVEIWNLVFTQFDRQDGGELANLPQQNIDTGLGFERLISVLQGKEDAYATDLFQPTIKHVSQLTGVAYEGKANVSHRVIADHVRAITFAIADGVLPTNEGAGYVVKMLLRRAARHSWILGRKEPTLHLLVDDVITAMRGGYPELAAAKERVASIIKHEEAQFLKNLESGIVRVNSLIDELVAEGETMLSGKVAFDLWQTHGFPLDLTEDIAAERNITVDKEGYAVARETARETSRSANTTGALFTASSDILGQLAQEHGETTFLGYEDMSSQSKVLALLNGDSLQEAAKEGDTIDIVLEQTPFYAEGGGQIGDRGTLSWTATTATESQQVQGKALVSNTTKTPQGLFIHHAKILRGTLETGSSLLASVDPIRYETQKHHSATHLLHGALRSVLGTHVAQAGSLVTADKLRFDFSHSQALTREEIDTIEQLVNRWIQADVAVAWKVVPIEEARASGAMMLFGEKYGNEVRMVSMVETATLDHSTSNNQPAASIELCGGTHVRRTGEIGSFAIVSEEAVSSGVRRIEALTGQASTAYNSNLRKTIGELVQKLGSSPQDVLERVNKLQADLKEAQKQNQRLQDKLVAAQTSQGNASETQEAHGLRYVTMVLEGLDAAALRNAADTTLSQNKADFVVIASGAALVVKASKDAQDKGVHAGNLIREIAKRAGGGGGGRPDMAQAGIKDVSKLEGAFADIPELLGDLL